MRATEALFALGATVASVACFQNDDADGGSDGGKDGEAGCTLFCVDSGPFVDPFGDASLAIRTRALFKQTCAGGPETGCHSEKAANLTMTLDPDGGDTINFPSTEMPGIVRVSPFDAGGSYMFWKVTNDPRIDGGPMPLNLTPDPRIPQLIGSWIEAGAP